MPRGPRLAAAAVAAAAEDAGRGARAPRVCYLVYMAGSCGGQAALRRACVGRPVCCAALGRVSVPVLSGMGAAEYRYLQRLDAHLSRMGASWLSGARVCRLCRAAGAAVRFVP